MYVCVWRGERCNGTNTSQKLKRIHQAGYLATDTLIGQRNEITDYCRENILSTLSLYLSICLFLFVSLSVCLTHTHNKSSRFLNAICPLSAVSGDRIPSFKYPFQVCFMLVSVATRLQLTHKSNPITATPLG